MKYKVKESFKSLCCGNYFEIGNILGIIKQTSKNRLSIIQYELIQGEYRIRGCHNVKRSTFFRCCNNIEDKL